jgi:hypothetical protein
VLLGINQWNGALEAGLKQFRTAGLGLLDQGRGVDDIQEKVMDLRILGQFRQDLCICETFAVEKMATKQSMCGTNRVENIRLKFYEET